MASVGPLLTAVRRQRCAGHSGANIHHHVAFCTMSLAAPTAVARMHATLGHLAPPAGALASETRAATCSAQAAGAPPAPPVRCAFAGCHRSIPSTQGGPALPGGHNWASGFAAVPDSLVSVCACYDNSAAVAAEFSSAWAAVWPTRRPLGRPPPDRLNLHPARSSTPAPVNLYVLTRGGYMAGAALARGADLRRPGRFRRDAGGRSAGGTLPGNPPDLPR